MNTKTKTVAVAAAKATTAVVAPVSATAAFPTDAELVSAGFDNLSKRIRELARLGAKTGEIAKIVLRANGEHPKYQHVRNVLNTPLKKVESGNSTGADSETPASE